MPNNIDRFKLPREDWYDQEGGIDEHTGEVIGRIYKDALIENFNAIEEKSLELQGLDVLNISIPSPTGFSYNDSNLENSADNQVVNLKSLVKILGLNGYPLKLSFNKAVCTLCKFYKLITTEGSESVKIVTIENLDTKATTTNKYIYIDLVNETLISSSSSTLDKNRYKFIAFCYATDKIIHQRSPLYPTSTTIKGE